MSNLKFVDTKAEYEQQYHIRIGSGGSDTSASVVGAILFRDKAIQLRKILSTRTT